MPVEFAISVYEDLVAAGADLGLRNAGYYAIESLRLEKGYHAWGRELTPTVNPYEAGLAFAVNWDKGDFRGRAALQRVRAAGGSVAVRRGVVSVLADSDAKTLWGNELLLRDGEPSGFVTSAAFGHTVGRSVALALVARADAPIDETWLESGAWTIVCVRPTPFDCG